MGKEDKTELVAVADVLAEVIAFLLPYKDELTKAVITDRSENPPKGSPPAKGNLNELIRKFKQIKRKITTPIGYLCDCIGLIIALDKMIDIRMREYINDDSVFIQDNNYVCIDDGLNSDTSRMNTELTILPRYKTMWEGSGEDREIVRDSFNRLLQHSRYVELKNGLVDGRYRVRCFFLNRDDAVNQEMILNREQFIRVGMCPMSMKFKLERIESEGIHFTPKSWGDEDIKRINYIIGKAIENAEKAKLNILVFPEMLGYSGIEKYVYKCIRDADCKYLKLIVLPSVWEIKDGKGSNTSYLVHGGNADMIFAQGKLVAYNDDTVIEAIEPSDTLNLLYDEIHGCVGILICKSELEDSVRDMFVKELGVKLILCPSWSRQAFTFETTILANAMWNANMIWTNSCSAFDSKNYRDLRMQPVCIATHFCKTPGLSSLEPEKIYPITGCKKECLYDGEPCLFITKIMGYVEYE